MTTLGQSLNFNCKDSTKADHISEILKHVHVNDDDFLIPMFIGTCITWQENQHWLVLTF